MFKLTISLIIFDDHKLRLKDNNDTLILNFKTNLIKKYKCNYDIE